MSTESNPWVCRKDHYSENWLVKSYLTNRIIAECRHEGDAEIIVKAVNCHHGFVAACRKALDECVDLIETPAGKELENMLDKAGLT